MINIEKKEAASAFACRCERERDALENKTYSEAKRLLARKETRDCKG
jgi:hypothetical protein